MITWPEAYFPKPAPSYGENAFSSKIRSNMDSGEIRQRKRFSTMRSSYSVQWELDDEQREVFRSIYENHLNQGNDYFLIDLPVDGGFKQVTARFVGDYSTDNIGILFWRISATLEAFDVDIMPCAEVDTLTGIPCP